MVLKGLSAKLIRSLQLSPKFLWTGLEDFTHPCMHHKASTIQTGPLDQRLLAAVITIEIAFGNISNIITFAIANPIDVFRWAV